MHKARGITIPSSFWKQLLQRKNGKIKMTGKMPKSKSLKHIDSEKGTWTKKETDDGRGCGAVRPRTLGFAIYQVY